MSEFINNKLFKLLIFENFQTYFKKNNEKKYHFI